VAPKLIIEVSDKAGRTLHTVEVNVDELEPGQGTEIHNIDIVNLRIYRELPKTEGGTAEIKPSDGDPPQPKKTSE